ncbi:MAG: type I 3-dehydroquinate dehydratase [Deltaproteobacteria bacterium]
MAGIAVPISLASAGDVDSALALGVRAAGGGADLIEWRVDRLASEDAGPAAVERLVREGALPAIVTCRAADEGGAFTGTEGERVGLLDHLLVAGAIPAYVDVEYGRWIASSDLADATSGLRVKGTKIILSAHDFSGRPEKLDDIFLRIDEAPGSDVTKVAWRAESVLDSLECAARLQQRRRETIVLCMGEPGLLTRVFAGLWGGLLTFAALEAGQGSAPGQPTLKELRETYRIAEIDGDTELHPIFGDASEARAANAALRREGRNAVALPLGKLPMHQQSAIREALANSPFVRLTATG